MKLNYHVRVVTTDGNELESEIIEAETKRDAAGKAFAEMEFYGVENIFVSNEWDVRDRASYRQVGRTLREE